jgi:hypothetical protein
VAEQKKGKNRVHVDVVCADRLAEVQRLTERGASVLTAYPSHTTMLDPEGNEFCVFPR